MQAPGVTGKHACKGTHICGDTQVGALRLLYDRTQGGEQAAHLAVQLCIGHAAGVGVWDLLACLGSPASMVRFTSLRKGKIYAGAGFDSSCAR